MIAAVGYLRVSGKGQLDGDGFPRQREAIERFAAANGYVITGWFEERGVTGKSEWDDRDAWVEMVAAKPAVIIVENMSRLSREFAVQEIFWRALRKQKIRLLSADEPNLEDDNANPSRKLIRGVLGLVAEYDRSHIEAKLRAARNRKRAATGRCEGAKPYGEHPSRPEEVATLAVMRELKSSGRSYHAVSVELNARGLKPRRGPKWHYATVQRILQRTA